MGLADKIRKADDLPYEDVEVDEWGDTVRIRGLSSGVAGELLQDIDPDDRASWTQFKHRLLAATLCDPATNDPVFPGEPEVFEARSLQVVNRLFAVAQRMSGLGQEAEDEIEGN